MVLRRPRWHGFLLSRYIWDDQMRNNKKIAEGKSRSAFRYHPITMKWALQRLIKDGESSYEELGKVLGLPSARYLRE